MSYKEISATTKPKGSRKGFPTTRKGGPGGKARRGEVGKPRRHEDEDEGRGRISRDPVPKPRRRLSPRSRFFS